jgi:hypothetical protein
MMEWMDGWMDESSSVYGMNQGINPMITCPAIIMADKRESQHTVFLLLRRKVENEIGGNLGDVIGPDRHIRCLVVVLLLCGQRRDSW